MPTKNNDTTRRGQAAESLAATHLEKHGLRIIDRNFRVRGGEIDLIARDGRTLVFVEVRLRRRSDFGGAAASIGWHKRQRLIHAARCYLLHYPDLPCRFDCVLLDALDSEHLEWLRHAFTVDD